MTKDMPTRARAHARIAARHSVMKGIDPSDAGVCFMAEGLALVYGIERPLAVALLQQLLPHAAKFLQQGLVDRFAATVGVTPGEAETMIKQTLKNRNQKPTTPIKGAALSQLEN